MTTIESYRFDGMHDELTTHLFTLDPGIEILYFSDCVALVRREPLAIVQVTVSPAAELQRYRATPEGMLDGASDNDLLWLIEDAVQRACVAAWASIQAGSRYVFDTNQDSDQICIWSGLEFAGATYEFDFPVFDLSVTS